MPDLMLASQIASIVSAIASAAQLGISYSQAEARLDSDTIETHARALSTTYDDDELTALYDRIQTCRDRFISEGDGTKRVRCMCSVLNDAIIGNGGISPIDDWQNMHAELCQ